jgi:hypothetical protein
MPRAVLSAADCVELWRGAGAVWSRVFSGCGDSGDVAMTVDDLILNLMDIHNQYGNVKVVMADKDESPLPWRDCVVDYDEEYKVALIS